MKKIIVFAIALLLVGLLLGFFGRTQPAAVTAQPLLTFKQFLPLTVKDFDSSPPGPTPIQITQELLEPTEGTPSLGDSIVVHVGITNTGSISITQLPVELFFDARFLELLIVQPHPTTTLPGNLVWDDITVDHPMGAGRDLGPGESLNIELTFRVIGCPPAEATPIRVKVVGAVDEDGQTVGRASNVTNFQVTCPAVTLSKRVVEPMTGIARVGDEVTFMIVVQNTGNQTVSDLPLKDTFDPNYLSYVSATPPPDSTDPPGTLTWNNLVADQPLPAGERITVMVTLRAVGCPAGQAAENTAMVSGALALCQGRTCEVPDATASTSVDIPCPDLRVEKRVISPDDGVVQPGDQVTFEITLENTGNKPLAVLPLDDIFDSQTLEFVSADPEPVVVIENLAQWDDLTSPAPNGFGDDLAPGETFTVTVTFRVVGCPYDQTALNEAKVSGAIAISQGQEWSVPQVSATARLTVETGEIPCPAISVTKRLLAPAGGVAQPGDTVTFEVAVTNVGTQPIVTLPLEDDFESEYLEFVSATPKPQSASSDHLTWLDLTGAAPYGFGRDLLPGETFVVTVHFKVIGCPPEQTSVNEARVRGALAQRNGTEYPVPPTLDSATVDIVCSEIRVTKRILSPTGGPAKVGDPIVFSITIENVGNKTVTVLPLEDVYNPSYLEFVEASVTPDVAIPGHLQWDDLTDSFGDLTLGAAIAVTVQFRAMDCPGGQTTPNQAKVEGAIAEHDGMTFDVPMAVSTAVAEIACPDLNVVKTLISPASGVVRTGELVTYQITLEADGNKTIYLLPLDDIFDLRYLEFVEASVTPDVAIPGLLQWDDLTGDAPFGFGQDLTPGETFELTVTFRAVGCPPSQVTVNTARVRGAAATHNGVEYHVRSMTRTATVRIACPALQVSKYLVPLACGIAGIGDPVNFNVVVENVGNTTLEQVTLLDTYSTRHLQFDSAMPVPSDHSVVDEVGTLTWADLTGPAPQGFDRDLRPGEAFNVAVNFTAIASTQAVYPPVTLNFADVFGVDEYGYETPDTAAAEVGVGVADADLFIEKEGPDETHPGGTITYQVHYGNNGPDSATYVRVLDTIPAGTEFVGDTLCGHVNTGCFLGTLPAGFSHSFEVQVFVPFDVLPGTTLENTISIESGQTPSGPVCGVGDSATGNNGAISSQLVVADFGEAPDPPYATSLASGGPYHADFTKEWLGEIVLGEPDAHPDVDNDGVILKEWYRAGRLARVPVQVMTSGLGAERYGREPERRLYLRAWIDYNGNGSFEDPGELVAVWNGAPGTVDSSGESWPLDQPGHKIELQFTTPLSKQGWTWARFRLSYGAPVGPTGQANFGEVEDYSVGFFLSDP